MLRLTPVRVLELCASFFGLLRVYMVSVVVTVDFSFRLCSRPLSRFSGLENECTPLAESPYPSGRTGEPVSRLKGRSSRVTLVEFMRVVPLANCALRRSVAEALL